MTSKASLQTNSVLPKHAVGFALSHEQFPAPQLIDIGIAAEKAGFDAVWTSDHFHPWMANEGHSGYPWLTLALLGDKLKKISIGTGVTCPTIRHQPAEVAQAFASLGVFYPGRVFLGVGAGEAVNEKSATGTWVSYAERAERLTEAVDVIRQLWSGEWVTHNGKYYQLHTAHLYDLPNEPIPIYVAASAPKSMHLAGKIGDGLITDSKRALDKDLRAAFEEGAREAGKDPSTMPVIAEHFVVVGDKKDAEQAAKLWRFTVASWSKYVNFPDPRAILNDAEKSIPLEEVYADWPVSTDPKVHAEALQKLFDAGVTQVFVHSGQPDQQAVIDFYGQKVLPLVKHPEAAATR